MPPRVSAAMIVRNEAAFLDDCLASVAGEVDEIVIVDTGSSDRTREIAAQHGARVFERPWNDDFSAARNCALEQATGDWILYIDADERLAVPTAGALRTATADPGVVALSVLFEPKVGYTPYREPRLFRRDGRIRFRGVIHETVHPDLQTLVRTGGMRIEPSAIRIRHVGYEGDLTHKHRRNLPLLEEAVKASPHRVFLWVDMARALAALDRREDAERACRHAIEAARTHPDPKQASDSAMAWQCLVNLHLDAEPAQALQLARQAAGALPDHHGLQLLLAGALFAAGESEPIPALLTPLLAIDAETLEDSLVAYDKRIFGEWSYDLLGAAYARMGRRREAARAFARAAQLAPDNLAYRAKAAAFSGGLGR